MFRIPRSGKFFAFRGGDDGFDFVKGLVAVSLITALFWSADWAGTTDWLNGRANDCLVRSVARLHEDRANVLLIYADRQDLAARPDSLPQLLRTLCDLGARGIGCTFPLDDVNATVPDLGEMNKWLFLAADEDVDWYDLPDSDLPQLAAVPSAQESDAAHGAELGLVSLLPTRDGICRDHYVTRPDDVFPRLSLEAAMANRILVDRGAIPDDTFGVNFRGGVNSLPFFCDQDVFEGRLVRNLVEGKVVLIGYPSDAWSPGVMTPTTGETRMPRLEFHGHALNTLIAGKPLWRPSNSGTLALFLVTGLIGYGINRRIDLRWTAGFTTLLVVGFWGCAWLTLWWFRLRLPLVSLVGVQLMCLLAVCEQRFRLSRATLSRLLMQQTVKTRVLRSPTNFTSSSDPWSDLSDLVYQLFYLNRLVIFELQPRQQHVIPVKTVNCELDEMAERRRDFRRPPFAEATESKSPVRVDAREFRFFRRHRQDETQFLAAATYRGELMGFLAVDVTSNALETFQDFGACLQRMADEVGALLAHWRTVQGSGGRMDWTRLWTELPEQPLITKLNCTNRALERRIGCLETVFEGAAAAAAIYDLFGRTLLMNREMFQIMQDRGTVPAEMSAVEMLAVLSERDWNQCRRILRSVVMFHRSESIFVPGHGNQRARVLYLRPLPGGAAPADGSDADVQPFQLQGVHFELLDSNSLTESQDVKDRITTRLCETLSNRLDGLRSAVARLRDSDVEPRTRQRVGTTADSLIGEAAEILTDCRSFLDSSPSTSAEDRVPVDIADVTSRVVKVFEDTTEPRGITIDVNAPDEVDDVLANPQLVHRMFEVIVELLVANARDYSQVRITVEDQVTTVGLLFENQGFGTSVDRLRAALDDDHVSSLDEFRRLKELRDWIEQWEGHMVVSTEMGSGIVIKLSLQKYLWGTQRQFPVTLTANTDQTQHDSESPKVTSSGQDDPHR